MDLQALTPALERLWIDELQSLCLPNPSPNPNLRPLHSTTFKRETKKAKKERKAQRKKEKREKREKERQLALAQQQSDLPTPSKQHYPTDSGSEWPVQPLPPNRSRTGWGDPNPPSSTPTTRPSTSEEKAKLAAVQLQQNALKTCRDFFSRMEGLDEDDEDDDVMEDDDEGECDNFKFFLGIFTGDSDLKRYYENKCEGGEFFCLVCGGIGEKIGKRFGDCFALIQHSGAISKTKRKAEHRAFGRAVCRVLGWDLNRLGSFAKSLDGGHGARNSDVDQDTVVDSVGTDNEELMGCNESS